MLYEISYEAPSFSGKVFVAADSPQAALSKFRLEWSLDGDSIPTCWVSGCQGVE